MERNTGDEWNLVVPKPAISKRTVYRDSEVISNMINGDYRAAEAIVDEDPHGNQMISWWFATEGSSFQGSGAVNIAIAEIAEPLRPSLFSDVGFASGSGGLRGWAHISGTSGQVAVREMQGSTSGSVAYFNATYAKLA